MRPFSKNLAYLLLAVTAACVTAFYGEFVKLKFGPLYILECAFIAWFALAFMSTADRLKFLAGTYKRLLWPTGLFFLWGILHLSRDAYFNSGALTGTREKLRFLQHAILFVYPLLWMCAGVWMALIDKKKCEWVILTVLVANTLSNIWDLTIDNFSLGPLIAVPFIICTERAIATLRKKQRSWPLWLLAANLGVLTFLPFWRMWAFTDVQRTSLVILLSIMTLTPYLLHKFGQKIKLATAAHTAAVACVFLIAGALVISVAEYVRKQSLASDKKPPTFASSVTNDIAISMQGAKARADNPEDIRIFWWKTAISDWRKDPIFGRGFIPEIPSMADSFYTNGWNTRVPDSKPISGPHNSYLTILARMGVLGLALFIVLAIHWLQKIRLLLKASHSNMMGLLLFWIPVGGAIHALFNIGLEGPHNCVLMWLFAGAALGASAQRKKLI